MTTSILFDVAPGLFGGSTRLLADHGSAMHEWGMNGWGMDGHWMGGWDGWLGIAFMVVFALLLATLVLAFVRIVLIPVLEATEQSTSENTGSTDALDVLRERFARGEIDEEEYERRREVLRRREN